MPFQLLDVLFKIFHLISEDFLKLLRMMPDFEAVAAEIIFVALRLEQILEVQHLTVNELLDLPRRQPVLLILHIRGVV